MNRFPLCILLAATVSSCSLPLLIEEAEVVEEAIEEVIQVEKVIQAPSPKVQSATQPAAKQAQVDGKKDAK